MKLAEPLFTFAEVLTATGAESSWLRTFIQRDKEGRLGTKHRTGRLLFSLNDISAIALLYRLNARMRIAPAAAWEILSAAGAIIIKANETDINTQIHVGFDEGEGVLIWTVGKDGLVQTWNDLADNKPAAAFAANKNVHIVIPMTTVFGPMVKALDIASEWPEGDKQAMAADASLSE